MDNREVELINARELKLHTDIDITIKELMEVCSIFLDHGKQISLTIDSNGSERTICRLGVNS